METIKRQSNFELLRLVAMFFIVVHHFSVHGIFPYWNGWTSGISYFNTCTSEFLYLGGKVAVDIFVILTGYFMINSEFKLEKAINIYLKTFFYSILIMFACFIYGSHHISSILLNHSLFPIGSNSYWFISRYLFLYLLVPFINIFIKNTNSKMHLYLIIFLVFFWSILQTFTRGYYNCESLGWFILLYIIGSYVKLYPKKIYNNVRINIFSILSVCLLSILIIFLFNYSHFTNVWKIVKYFSEYSLIDLIIALNAIFIFKNISISSKIINWTAKSTIAVYLIHDNEFVRPFLWQRLFHVVTYMNSKYFLLWIFGISLFIFIFCIFIDKMFNLIFNKVIIKLSYSIKNYFNKFVNSTINLIE